MPGIPLRFSFVSGLIVSFDSSFTSFDDPTILFDGIVLPPPVFRLGEVGQIVKVNW